MFSFAPQNKMMKKTYTNIFLFILFFCLITTNRVLAASCNPEIDGSNSKDITTEKDAISITYDVTGYTQNEYKFSFPGSSIPEASYTKKEVSAGKFTVSHSFKVQKTGTKLNYSVQLLRNINNNYEVVCQPVQFSIQTPKQSSCTINIIPQGENADTETKWDISVTNPPQNNINTFVTLIISSSKLYNNVIAKPSDKKTYTIGPLAAGNYTTKVMQSIQTGSLPLISEECSNSFSVGPPGTKKEEIGKSEGSKCDRCGWCPLPGTAVFKDDSKPNDWSKCDLCFSKGTEPEKYGPGSWSALGCIPTGPEKFIQWLLNSAINIVGGLAFLMILFGSFKVATSSGNPEALNEGKDIIFAALAGLLFIVFSVILLKIIGQDILQIPGFSG